MAPPSWAYQVDNFDPPPDEELVCSVCRGVFCDPIQSPCNHVFCRGCLFKWLENNRSCPICRKRTARSSVQEVVPLIKNMIMKLTLRCRNWENHCREKFTLEACEAHMRVCAFEMIQCKNKPCVKMFLRKDIKEHELKNCTHRTVRCLKCYLKIPPNEQSHDCIAALKRKVKARDEDIKKKNKKIKDLENELTRMQDAQQAVSSDISSLGSVSAADILIDLEDMQSLSSSSSSSDDSSSPYDSDGYETRWFDFLEDSTTSNSTVNIIYGSDILNLHHDDSSEFPRTSGPELLNESSFLGTDVSGSLEEEPVIRRPAKRRHPAQLPDTSDDDDNNNLGIPSLPSPKRSWHNLLRRASEASRRESRQNDQTSDCAAGPSHASSHEAAAPESSRNQSAYSPIWSPQLPMRSWKPKDKVKTESAAGPSRVTSYTADELKALRCKVNDSAVLKLPKDLPVLRHGTKKPANELTSTPIQNGSSTSGLRTSPAFERTLAMLEQYNLESDDDEWRPANRQQVEDESSDSDINEGNGCLDDSIPRSDASSYCDSSDSSFEAPARTDWFTRLFQNGPESDPDWSPH